jgi:pimeloyl-ACP methyl ester carboxylesterase
MRSNRKLRWLIFAVLLYLALGAVGGVYLADATLHPARRALTELEAARFRQSVRVHSAQLQDASITARDGTTLQAWIVRPSNPNGDAVLLLHGLGDNRLGMTGYAELLLAHGFTVLLPDARAHGASGGDLATFGLLERYDIVQWSQFLRAQTAAHCLFGIGESMGAAQLLQSIEAGAAFCSVIAESAFSNFREIAYDRMGQPFHAGPWVGRTVLWPLVEIAFLRVRWKYGLDMQQVSPEDAIATTKIPVLLIHGQVDSNIPVRHSLRIHDRDPDTAFWEVPGADHCGAIAVAPQQFEKLLFVWFSTESPGMKRIVGEAVP